MNRPPKQPVSGNAAHTDNARTREERLGQALDEFYSAIDSGQEPDRSRLLEKYADVADEFEDCLRNLDFIQTVAPQLAENAGTRDGGSRVNLGDFRIIREIGRGGMGVVYEAEQLSLGRKMALKVLPFAGMLDNQQLKRFKNEARAAATLDHPHIVAVHSVGEERGVHYYAMQLVEGKSLAEVISELRSVNGIEFNSADERTVTRARDHRGLTAPPPQVVESGVEPRCVSPGADTAKPLQAAISTTPTFDTREYFRTVAKLGRQAASALDHAHQHGILHRDVKPGNLMVDANARVFVTDFGLARMESDAGVTMTGDLIGTLGYMSPEQALAKRVVIDHRTDIYSLGVTLYELLTLKPPYDGKDRQELLKQIAFDEPRRPRQIVRRIPNDLETIVLKAIEKSPSDRYHTAQELADDLDRFLSDQNILARKPNLRQRAVKWSRRHQKFVASAATVMALLLVVATAAALLVWREQERTEKALDQARQSAAESEALVEFFVDDLMGAANLEDALGEQVTVQEVVSEAERRIEELQEQPLLQAAVLRAVGGIQLSLGNATEAERHLNRAREIQQRVLGPEHEETLKTMTELVEVLLDQRRYSEARQLAERTLEMQRRTLGPEHPDTLEGRRLLGICLNEQYSCRDARAILEKVLPDMRRVLGADAESTLDAQRDLADTLFELGDFQQGRELMQQTIAASEQRWGVEHPKTLGYKQSLAIELRGEDIDNEAALRIYQEILDVQERVYGPLHPRTLRTLQGIVKVHSERGEFERAVELYHDVYENVRAKFSPQHRRTLAVTMVWAQLLASQGKTEQALALFEDVVEARQQAAGTEHPDTLYAMRHLAIFLTELGRFEKAESLHRQITSVNDRVHGPEHRTTLHAQHYLGDLLREKGDVDKAHEVFTTTLALKRRILGPEHPRTLDTMHSLAMTLADQGELKEAADLYRQTIKIRRRVLGQDHVNVMLAMNNLAIILRQQGKPEAFEVCEEVFDTMERTMGPDSKYTLSALQSLATNFSTFGDYVRAVEIGREVLHRQRRVNGDEHVRTLDALNSLAIAVSRSGEQQEALMLFRECFEKRRKVHGPEHEVTLREMLNVAATTLDEDEALELTQTATEIARRVLPKEHPTLQRAMHNLSVAYWKEKDWTNLIEIRHELWEIRQRVFGPNDSRTLNTRSNFRWALEQRARAYTEENAWDLAAADWVRVIELSPDDVVQDWQSPRVAAWRELIAQPELHRRVSERMPDDTARWVGSGQYHAFRSNWTEAARSFDQAIAKRPIGDDTFQGVASLLLAERRSGYEQHCLEVLGRPDEPSRSFSAYVMARMCAIGDFDGVDSQQLVDWARWADESSMARHGSKLHVLGLCQYRAGRFEAAIRSCEQSLIEGWEKAQNWSLLAMARYQLGRYDQARAALVRANEEIATQAPASPGEPANVKHVPDWIAAQILRREAEALLSHEDESNIGSDQSDDAADFEEPAVIIRRGREAARRSEWASALRDYDHDIELRPVSDTTFEFAALLALTGREAEYQRVCAALMERSDELQHPFAGYIAARACAIADESGIDAQQLLDLADKATPIGRAHVWHVMGLVQYRAGRFHESIKSLRKSNAINWHQLAKAQNWIVMALARHQLQQDDKAREALNRAEAIIVSDGPRTPGEPANVPTPDWIGLELLRREAEAKLAPPDATAPQESDSDAAVPDESD